MRSVCLPGVAPYIGFAASLNEYCNRWCKREHVEGDALEDWKLNIFKIIDRRISFYSHNTNMLPVNLRLVIVI